MLEELLVRFAKMARHVVKMLFDATRFWGAVFQELPQVNAFSASLVSDDIYLVIYKTGFFGITAPTSTCVFQHLRQNFPVPDIASKAIAADNHSA